MQHQIHHSLCFVEVSLLLTKTTDLFSSAFNSENAKINSLFPPFLQLVVSQWKIHPVQFKKIKSQLLQKVIPSRTRNKVIFEAAEHTTGGGYFKCVICGLGINIHNLLEKLIKGGLLGIRSSIQHPFKCNYDVNSFQVNFSWLQWSKSYCKAVSLPLVRGCVALADVICPAAF